MFAKNLTYHYYYIKRGGMGMSSMDVEILEQGDELIWKVI